MSKQQSTEGRATVTERPKIVNGTLDCPECGGGHTCHETNALGHAVSCSLKPENVLDQLLTTLEEREAEVERLQRANDEKVGAINAALDELGIPGPSYPAPVAEAVRHLSRVVVRDAALSPTPKEADDGSN